MAKEKATLVVVVLVNNTAQEQTSINRIVHIASSFIACNYSSIDLTILVTTI